MKIKTIDIVDEFTACPYCGRALPDEYSACCQEVGHGVKAYELVNGEIVFQDEIKIVD